MDTCDLHRAAEEYVALLSEAVSADLAAPAGERTVGELTAALAESASGLASRLGTAPSVVPDGAGPPDLYGGGYERAFRRAVQRLRAAAASSDGRACDELADLIREIDSGAVALREALRLD
ncbi:hypothetical protein TPB0596_15710 [Tsukamurella pulmonis]|uniref:hypothetical protein n=1 Tax=Tsukamurella pulmonis TaxID=47312 RepID=UPI001EE0E3B0|nr:hypothetical protein [Tsukamurella pulmonis]BDD81808.1 hypothetical protein TPB0596_15710 [Tsukamurella pulmonis]